MIAMPHLMEPIGQSMPDEVPNPYELFCKAESQVMGLLGLRDDGEDEQNRLFSINAWDSVDRELLSLFPAISTALAVLTEEEQQLNRQPDTPKLRHSSSSASSDSLPRRSSPSSSSVSSSGSSRGSASQSRTVSPRCAPPPACYLSNAGLPFKDIQVLISKEDLANLPQANSLEEVMALLSKEDVIMVPTQGGTILYEITYLDDLAQSAHQVPTVVPPSPDDPANQLSPEVFNFFLQNDCLVGGESGGGGGGGGGGCAKPQERRFF